MHTPRTQPDDTAGAINALRPYLFAIAYRMTGSASEAEDIVQEAFLRYYASGPETVESPKAYLGTVVTRLSLDHLKSARVQREQYPGTWIPEPVLSEDVSPGPDVQAERRDDISIAFMVLLERLTPEERAAFVLREAFGYPYNDIAGILGKSAAACRKLVQRARGRLSNDDRKYRASFAEQQRLAEIFMAAARDGDVDTLTSALADDATIWVDGGPDTMTTRRPITGGDNISRYSAGMVHRIIPGSELSVATVNGEPCLLLWLGPNLLSVTFFVIADGKIRELRSVANPVKLDWIRPHLTPPSAETG